VQLIVVDPSTALAYANILAKDPPYNDKRFRQGLAHCLDLEGIKELVYAGRGTPSNNFIPALSWAYIELPNYEYDPEKAKALFAEAGVSEGFQTSILTLEGYPDLIAMAPIWQEGLKQAGIEASIETLEINAWIERFLGSDYELTFNFDINGPDPQRMFVADFLLHIDLGEWSDTTLTTTIKEQSAAAIATTDMEERKVIYADLQRLMHDELPTLPIYRPAIVTATSTAVTGFAVDGKGFYHFEQAAVAQDA
jgi:peptide/nickel transport system substrate-binding protein